MADVNSVLPPALDSNIVDVAAGVYGLALKEDGTPVSWGFNNYVPNGRLLADEGLKVAKIISGRHEELWGIKADRTVVAISQNHLPMCPFPNWTGVIDIAPQAINSDCRSWGYGFVLFEDGRVESYGLNNGQPVIVAPGAQGSKALVAADHSALVLKNDGTLFGWSSLNGDTNTDVWGASLIPPASATNVVAIAAGPFHYLALRADGQVVAWGSLPGGVEVPQDLTDVVQIAAGFRHSLALKRDGTLVAWGDTRAVGIMPGDRGVKVATADEDFYLVHKDGTVGHLGSAKIPLGLTNIVDIQTDPNGFVLALTSDGTVTSWNSGSTPVEEGLHDILAVADGGANFAGSTLNVVLRSDHTLHTWGGYQSALQQPDGFPNEHVFEGYPGVRSIHAGAGNVIAVLENGEVRVWSGGLVTPPPGLTDVVQAQIGGAHALALKADGTVVAWGNPIGGLPPVAEWTNMLKVAAGSVFCAGCRWVTGSLGLRADGTVAGWGSYATPPLSGIFEISTSGYNSAALALPPDPPTISSFCPPSANAGETVRLSGAGFLPVTEVRVNGLSAEFTRDFNFGLNVKIPSGATSGKVEVTSPYGVVLTETNVVVPNGLSPIQTWRTLNFGDAAEAGDAADDADPDSDGMVNLHEYFLHTNPRKAGEPVHVRARRVLEANGQRYFEFSIRRYALASDVTLHYEFKLDLTEAWKPFTGEVADASVESLGECQSENVLKRAVLPPNTTRFYLRYYITRP